MVQASADVQWQIIRRSSAFLRKQRGVNKTFSNEPFNVKGTNSIHYNGFVSKKGVDIRPTADGKNIQVTLKNKHKTSTPKDSRQVIVVKGFNSRRALKSVKNIVKNYRPVIALAATRRASQYLRAARPKKTKKVAAAAAAAAPAKN